MLEKVRERGIKDPLLFHKIGLAVGSLVGFMVGMVISDRAEEFDMSGAQPEEIANDSQESQPEQAAE